MLQKTMSQLCFSLLIMSTPALANEAVPVGKRHYLLENKAPFAPVDIRPLGSVEPDSTVMKDPIPLGNRPLLKKGTATHQPSASPKRVSRMVFDQVAVKGRYLVPRVSFERPELEHDRREEATTIDYRQKIKESEAILRDFDW